MPADTVITDARVTLPNGGRCGATVFMADGLIERVALEGMEPDDAPDNGVRRIDARGRLLTPGLIDLHAHGIESLAFESGGESLLAALGRLPAYGVTSVLPTLYRTLGPNDPAIRSALAAALTDCDTVHAPAFHAEGPFLRLTGAGGHTMAAGPAYAESLIASLDGRVAAMSLSPDTPGPITQVIQQLAERGIRAFLTHTQAGVDETVAAIDAGARHATHFYDVFEPPTVADPGVRPVGSVEAILADPRVTVDFIADGVHVHPMAIRAALAAKGASGVLAITDANVGAGLPPGQYDTPWGYPIQTLTGAARVDQPGSDLHDTLAGSTLTMPQAVANLRRWLDVSEHSVWAMATRNPADCMGWTNKGRLEAGADADLVLWDEDDSGGLEAWTTWYRGAEVFSRGVLAGGQV